MAGAIAAGVARFIVMLSAQTDVFGVGTTVIVGSRLVAASCVMPGWIVPGGGLAGISGVESVKAAPLVGGPPGVELHMVVDEVPTGDTGDMVPVVLATRDVGIVPKGVDDAVVVDGVIAAVPRAMDVETVPDAIDTIGTDGMVMGVKGRGGTVGGCGAGMVVPKISVMNDVAGCADSVRYGAVPLAVVDAEEAANTAGIVGAAKTDGSGPVALPVADVTETAGVPGAICPIGAAQVTTVPGVVGSDANGTGANVVPGVPGSVTAENGLGPLSGDVTIVPGVVGRPMAVVPIVETCARQALEPASRAAIVNSKRRIASSPPPALPNQVALFVPRPCCLPPSPPSD
ncbi:hypothetical protein [Bradyrhizobium valentinum]|uniref:hypothetical protein n=1 Tax=Bradyrhizobium valentinum TaxID=1518501 RepID=UPI000710B79B|nr:hypothetical protein [Bradyrhizobium valentinum]KRR04483.1 hypothetical protein CQ10_17375 [Bradyrhizobium valentinum]